MSESQGHRDAAEVLSEKYQYLASDFHEEPFPAIMDMDLFTEYLTRSVPGEQLLTFMQDEFSQGFLVGLILSSMIEDLGTMEESDEEF